MRLSDLDAEFVGGANAAQRSYRRQRGLVDGAQGVLFQCPVCAVGLEAGEEDGRRFFRGAHYVLVWFSNPRNAPPPDGMTPAPRWTFSGDSIDTLSTQPSIQLIGGCAWHGYLTNGEAA